MCVSPKQCQDLNLDLVLYIPESVQAFAGGLRIFVKVLHSFLSPEARNSDKVVHRHAQFSRDSLSKSHQAACFIRKIYSKTISLLRANESDDTWDWKWFQAKENRRKTTRFDGKRCHGVDLLLSTAYSLIKEFPKSHLLGNLLSCPKPSTGYLNLFCDEHKKIAASIRK